MAGTVVHIGQHKTGTTAIQDFMAGNRAALLATGVDFPELGRVTGRSQAHRHFSAYMRGAQREVPEGFESACRAYFRTAGRVVLSSEDFYFGSAPACIDRLFGLVPRIRRVVVFLRDPVDHVQSLYREGLKGIEAAGLETFIGRETRKLLAGSDKFSYYDFETNLGAWAARADLREVTYDKAGDVVRTLLCEAGIDFDVADAAHRVQRKNVARPAVVECVQQSVNRSLAAGRLEVPEFRRLKKWILQCDPAGLTRDFGPHLREHWIDLRPFRAAFERRNPRYRALCATSAERAAKAELPAEHDAAVLEALRAGTRVA